MPQRDVRVYLLDAIGAAEEVVAIRTALTSEQLRTDRVVRAAIERHLITLGETIRRAVELEPSLEETISHCRAIIGLRNRLVHGYFAIDSERIALVAESDVDTVLAELRKLVA